MTRSLPKQTFLPTREHFETRTPDKDAIQINNYIEDHEEPDTTTKQVYSHAFGVTLNVGTPSRPTSVLKKITTTIIRTGLLIPGDGEPQPNAALVIQNKLIVWLGSQNDIPSEYTSGPHKGIETAYLMPGLWECHWHFMAPGELDPPDYSSVVTVHPGKMCARLAKMCWQALQMGYTSGRDLAGYGPELAECINDGTIVGPNVYAAGACISQLGGHGDAHPLPAGIMLSAMGVTQTLPAHMGAYPMIVADGVEEVIKATRLQIRRGAKCIKIIAGGGVMSRDDDVTCAQYSEEELRAIVQEAHRQKRRVAAHVHAKEAILAAVRAGVDTVEHISFADEECIKAIKEAGVIIVATRAVTEFLLETGGKGLAPSVWEKAKLTAASHDKAYKLAIEHGCILAMGADTAPGEDTSPKELEYAVKFGLSNLDAIKAATATAALTVGAQAPKTGQLKVGYEADILGLTENPVEDIKVLQKKDNIKWVWKGGKLFKGPGIGPWGEE